MNTDYRQNLWEKLQELDTVISDTTASLPNMTGSLIKQDVNVALADSREFANSQNRREKLERFATLVNELYKSDIFDKFHPQ